MGRPDHGAGRRSTAGCRSSRTAARPWVPPTRIRTARSGPAPPCPIAAAREDAAQRRHCQQTGHRLLLDVAGAGIRWRPCRGGGPSSGWRWCRSGRSGPSRRCSPAAPGSSPGRPRRGAARWPGPGHAAADATLRRALRAAHALLDRAGTRHPSTTGPTITGRSTPTSCRRCWRPPSASSWSATSSSPSRSATSRPRMPRSGCVPSSSVVTTRRPAASYRRLDE